MSDFMWTDYTIWILNGTEGIYHVVETIPKSQKLQSNTGHVYKYRIF